jgi:DNA-binding IclR family transcriptional regulator
MSTSPKSIRVGDRVVTAISRWLAHHLSDDELRAELEAVDLTDFTPTQAEAVLELLNELDVGTERPALEMIAREALEAVAVGD